MLAKSEARKQYLSEWRDKNRQKINELARTRYRKNPEKLRIEAKERYHRNPERNKAAAKAWKLKNREYVRKYSRMNSVRYCYGLSFEDYLAMEEKQQSVCAICSEPSQNRRLDVDHSHETGKVRELICNRCNRLIAILEQKRDLARLAVEYLEKHDASRI